MLRMNTETSCWKSRGRLVAEQLLDLAQCLDVCDAARAASVEECRAVLVSVALKNAPSLATNERDAWCCGWAEFAARVVMDTRKRFETEE